ncbi:MAG: PAS domain S-box protein [Spirochaetales bacterium]|nr:PAS domain S-box protein [Spirochaetales bacterium]
MRIKRSFKNTFTFYFILVAVLPLMLTGIANTSLLKKDLSKDIYIKNLMLSRSISDEIGRFLKTSLLALRQVADITEKEKLIGTYGVNLQIKSLIKYYDIFNSIVILDNNGVVRNVEPFSKDYIGINLSGMDFFKMVKKTEKPYWSRTLISSRTGMPTVTLALPFHSGFVVGYVDLEALNRITDRISLGSKAYTIVTDRNGIIIVHPDRTLIFKRVNIKNLKIIAEGLSGKEGTYRVNYNEVENIGSVTTIPEAGWVTVIIQPVSDAFLGIDMFLFRYFIAFIIVIIISFIFAYLALRRAILPLSKLILRAKAIANGSYNIKPLPESYAEIDELEADFRLMIQAVNNREKKLKESEKKYRLLVEKMNDGFEVEDENEIITFVNAKFCEIVGYSKNELIGNKVYMFLDEETKKLLEEQMARRKRGEIKSYELQFIRKDGKKKYTIVSPQGIFDDAGNFKGSFAVVTDITERKQMEEDKRKLDNQVQRMARMDSIGTLAGGIAHDFNNLLMAISGSASLLLIDKNPGNPDYENLKIIEKCVKEGSSLTKQLLGFARGGKYDVKPTDLNDIIDKSSKMFGSTKKEIVIHADYEKDIWTVKVDRGQMEQVLMNLYVNAWQAMPSGGDLYLRTENVTLDEAFVKKKPFKVEPGEYVKLSVTDTGIGMDEDTKKRVFDPFFTTKERGMGTGLGLASTYGIVKNHNGLINVYSERGKGTTFNIYLPAVKEAVTPGVKVEDGIFVTDKKETILLVDDEEMIRKVAKKLFKRLNYRVMVACNGKNAINIYKKNYKSIDLVILDMIMPGMGGGETYDNLKKINPEIKVLLSSGYSMNGEAKTIMDRGINGFIQKPFNLMTLSKKLKEIFKKTI